MRRHPAPDLPAPATTRPAPATGRPAPATTRPAPATGRPASAAPGPTALYETILFNELDNCLRSDIYLYRSRTAGMWCACGYSAYKLFRLAADAQAPCLHSFSTELMMPLATLDDAALDRILARTAVRTAAWTAGLCLTVPGAPAPDRAAYRCWAAALRSLCKA